MEILLRLLNALGMLAPANQIRLELLVLSRIALELDSSARRVENLRCFLPVGSSMHTRIVNASMQTKVAAGNLKMLDESRSYDR